MNTDPTSLDRLHDLVVPPPVPWWPPQPGWMILMAAGALAVIGLVVKAFMRWQANRYRREALDLLGDTPLDQLSALAKRVALTSWPRGEVANLTGSAWLAFLDRSSGLDLFTNGPARRLEDAAYGGSIGKDEEGAIRGAVRDWILKHRKEVAP